MIGERILRRNHNYPDEPQQWIETLCNKTYIELIIEFPEDFRSIDGAKIIKGNVKCDICATEWLALYYEDSEWLECPHCHQQAYYEVI